MRAVVVMVALAAFAGAGRASPPDDALDLEVARRHFEKAKTMFGAKDYEGALRELLIARSVRELPDFDYNIARCYDALERYPEAIAEYKRYVFRTPNLPDADEARSRVAVLKKRMAALEAAGTRLPPGGAPPSTPPPSAVAPAPVAPAPPEPRAAPSPAPVAAPLVQAPRVVVPPLVVARPRPARTPLYKKWWLWTAVGGAAVIVIAVGVGVGVGASGSPPGFKASLDPFGPNAPQAH
ncbi:MAG TPA: hypothetical protein VFF06_27360 [Polyangia bacterium]|nr:hypothetical protein [Polyangia bacterium]